MSGHCNWKDFRLGAGCHFVPVKVNKHWNTFPKALISSLKIPSFKESSGSRWVFWVWTSGINIVVTLIFLTQQQLAPCGTPGACTGWSSSMERRGFCWERSWVGHFLVMFSLKTCHHMVSMFGRGELLLWAQENGSAPLGMGEFLWTMGSRAVHWQGLEYTHLSVHIGAYKPQ